MVQARSAQCVHVDEACQELIVFRVGESWLALLFLSPVARSRISLQRDPTILFRRRSCSTVMLILFKRRPRPRQAALPQLVSKPNSPA